MQKQEDRLLLGVVQPEIRSLYDPENDEFRSQQIQSLNNIVDRVRERRTFQEIEAQYGEQVDNSEAVSDVEEVMANRLFEVRGEEHADAFKRSKKENKNETLTELHKTEQREQVLRQNLSAAVEAGDAGKITALTHEIRNVRLQNRSLQRRVEVLAFEQLAEDSVEKHKKARDKLSGEFSVENVKETLTTFRDAARSKIRAGQESLRQGVDALYDTVVSESVESAKERVMQFWNGVDNVALRHAGNIISGAGEKIRETADRAVGFSKQQDAEQEERRLDRVAEYYRQRHQAEQTLRRGMAKLAGRSEEFAQKLKVSAAIVYKEFGRAVIASSEEAKQARTQEIDDLKTRYKEIGDEAEVTIEEKLGDIDKTNNPYMIRFQEALLNKVQNMSVELPEQATSNGGDGVDESELEGGSAVQTGGQAPLVNERNGGSDGDGGAEGLYNSGSTEVPQDFSNTDVRQTPDGKSVIFKWNVNDGGVYSSIYVKLDNGELENVGTAQTKKEVNELIQGHLDKMSQ